MSSMSFRREENRRLKELAASSFGFMATAIQYDSLKYDTWIKIKNKAASKCVKTITTVEAYGSFRHWVQIFSCMAVILSLVGSVFVLGRMISQSVRRTPRTFHTYLFMVSAALDVSICTILYHAVSGYKKDDVTAAYAASFYRCIFAGVSNVVAAGFAYSESSSPRPTVRSEAQCVTDGRTVTAKQHQSRLMMNPNLRSNRKMTTFSTMPCDMEAAVVELSIAAMQKFETDDDIAEHIKTTCDRKFGSIFHCLVGDRFGSSVTHLCKDYLEITLPRRTILLFRNQRTEYKSVC